MSRQTICDWRNHDSLFAAELNRRRQEVSGCQAERLRNLVGRAVDVLAEDLKSQDPELRQAAAVHILSAVGLWKKWVRSAGFS